MLAILLLQLVQALIPTLGAQIMRILACMLRDIEQSA